MKESDGGRREPPPFARGERIDDVPQAQATGGWAFQRDELARSIGSMPSSARAVVSPRWKNVSGPTG
jgi:hypothetical protein